MFALTNTMPDLLGFSHTFNSIEYRASCAGRKTPSVKHHYRARPTKVRLKFRRGNTLGLTEGTMKKMQAVRLGDKLYFPNSHGWRRADKYARKVGAVIVD